jgi:hypothetical protein
VTHAEASICTQPIRALTAQIGRSRVGGETEVARAEMSGVRATIREGFADAELALRAMGDLTERHFRVLAVIAKSEVVGAKGSENYRQFTAEYVATMTGMSEETAHQCLLNLAAAGLSVQRAVMGQPAYPITELGRAVVDAAVQVTGN